MWCCVAVPAAAAALPLKATSDLEFCRRESLRIRSPKAVFCELSAGLQQLVSTGANQRPADAQRYATHTIADRRTTDLRPWPSGLDRDLLLDCGHYGPGR